MQMLAMEVSPGLAVGWTLGCLIVGGVVVWVFGPPVYAWWQSTMQAARLGVERVVMIAGVVALLGGALWVAAYYA